MSPLIKKTIFRMKKLERPLKPNGEKKKFLIAKELRRGIVALLLLSLTIGVIYAGKFSARVLLHEGDVAIADIFAPFDFKYASGIDAAKTKDRQFQAASNVLDVYEIDTAVLERSKNSCKEFFARLSALEIAREDSVGTIETDIFSDLGISIDKADISRLIAYPDKNGLKQEILTRLEDLSAVPIISAKTKRQLQDSSKEAILLYDSAKKEEVLVEVTDLLDESSRRATIDALIQKDNISDKDIRDLLQKLFIAWVVPNIKLNEEVTSQSKKEAMESASPVYEIAEMSKGEVVVRKGQRVIKEHLIQLGEINKAQAQTDTYSQLWGIIIIVSLLAFLMFVYLKLFEPNIFNDDKLLLLIGVVILLSAIAARIIVFSPLPSYFIPIASVAMLITLLVSGSVAAIVAVATAVIVTLIAGIRFNIFLIALISGITAICTIYNARSRNSIIRSGLIVGALNLIAICGIGIISNFNFLVYIKEGMWGMASGLASAAVVMLLLPVFESLFKLTTDIKLLELSDLNHPLLKEMVTKATGTYHHSMVVGNLAEAAADAISANPLLARVGSYYHDIGKIEKSEYFAENKQVPSDLHERLSPSMSSLIITNHVKDAMELAEKHKLGSAIKDIMQQHHGTGLVTYFYHQAVEKTQAEEAVSEENFRYPGPKPQTKESAIVMLADSVEAASRVLTNPTPQRLKELVRKIINNKFIDRQLDECDLTLKNINKIADSFVKILTGIYHSRVEYPNQKLTKHGNNNNKRSKENKS